MSRWLAAFRGGAESVVPAAPKTENPEKGENRPCPAPGATGRGEFSGFSTFSDFGAEKACISGQPAPPLHPDDDPEHQARLDGYRRAALRRSSSLPMNATPGAGCFCACCAGQAWWCEREAPSGWRCATCYPTVHLPADAVRRVGT